MIKNVFVFSLALLLAAYFCNGQQILQESSKSDSTLRVLKQILQYSSGKNRNEQCPDSDALKKAKEFLDTAPDVIDGTGSPSQIQRKNNLVSDYAFRKLIKKNFNNIILGTENYSKISRYATLDLSEKPAFSFTPYYFESDPIYAPYKNIISINISGKLNDENFFGLSDWRDLSGSISYTRILNYSNYKTIAKPSSLKTNYLCKIKPLIKDIFENYSEKFASFCSSDSCFSDNDEFIIAKNKIIGDLIEDYSDAEIKAADEFWKNKNFLWYKLDAKILAFDKIRFIPSDTLQIPKYHPYEELIYTPSLSLALNYLTKGNKKDNSVLLTGWVSLNKKHSLSEVFDPDDFQPFHTINDSLIQLKSKEEVFVTSFNKIENQIIVDYGIRVVAMADISSETRPRQIGMSVLFSRSGLVHEDKYPSLFKTEVGAVFPFLGKDGESEFNLELFYRWNIYSNFPNTNERFLGLRFNVPINSN